MTGPSPRELLSLAATAAEKAYAPYSRFRVGAALLASSGRVYTGVNVENASYPCGICAERSAVAQAVSDGERGFAAIALAALPEGSSEAEGCTPCGMCRQVLCEFSPSGELPVYTFSRDGGVERRSLAELLPCSFSAGRMTGSK